MTAYFGYPLGATAGELGVTSNDEYDVPGLKRRKKNKKGKKQPKDELKFSSLGEDPLR